MPQVINTNVAAINAQRNLNKSQSAMQINLQRLSSGLRINSAKDDAAGLAISDRFIAQINGMNQASRNANDGISLAQTAEGALDEVTNALQRMRTLAVQAANDTNSEADRQAIQLEINQLRDEINRIGNTTQFNGKYLLNGSDVKFSFHIGANAYQNLEVTMGDMRASALGRQPGAVQSVGHRIDIGGTFRGIAPSGDVADAIPDFIAAGGGQFLITIANGSSGVDISEVRYGGDIAYLSNDDITTSSGLYYGGGIAKSIAERINNIREMNLKDANGRTILEGVYAKAETRFSIGSASPDDLDTLDNAGIFGVGFRNVAGGTINHEGLRINGINIGPVTFQKNDTDGSLVNAINAKSQITGVTARINNNGELDFLADDGRDIIIETGDAASANLLFAGGGLSVNGPNAPNFTAPFGLRIAGSITISAQQTITIAGDAPGLAGFDPDVVEGTDVAFGEGIHNNVQAIGTIDNADVTTVEGANRLIQSVDSALEQVDGLRAKLGAVQNRFEMTIRNLDNVAENLSAANSRIRDADFAKETTEMTRNQILQQAGTAILAQANAQTQNVMQLLQG